MSVRLNETDFTIIVPTRNRAQLAFKLACYVRTEMGWKCPLVFIDQSDDGGEKLRNLLTQAGMGGITHRFQPRRGTSAARNEGVGLARTDWLLFLDDDVRPVCTHLESLIDLLEANPWLDGVQGAIEYELDWETYQRDPDKWLVALKNRPALRKKHPPSWDAMELLLRTPKSDYSCLVMGLGSGNLALSRTQFLRVGGFDERMEGLGEDVELGFRLWWYGYRVCLCPAAVGFHLRESTGGTRDKQARWKILFHPEPAPSLIYFLLKWFPGRPFHDFLRLHLGKLIRRRPWLLPLKLIRLCRAIGEGKRLVEMGPLYLADPISRDTAQQHTRISEQVTA